MEVNTKRLSITFHTMYAYFSHLVDARSDSIPSATDPMLKGNTSHTDVCGMLELNPEMKSKEMKK